MELIDIIPEFNLYEEFWKIYTNSEILPPQYISAQSVIERSIICNGAEVYGEVHNSIIGSGVIIGEGSVIKDSIIMKDARIGKNTAVSGVTSKEDYPDGVLESGETLIKAGGQA